MHVEGVVGIEGGRPRGGLVRAGVGRPAERKALVLPFGRVAAGWEDESIKKAISILSETLGFRL